MKDARQRFIAYAISKVGCPYVWTGKGSRVWTSRGLAAHAFGLNVDVFDCSGLVGAAYLAGTGLDWRATHSAQTYLDTLAPLDEPEPGCLALYGPGAGVATHVMVHVALGVVVGASGGDHRVTSPDAAAQRERETGHRCAVTCFPSHLYRRDFLGWRALRFDVS